MAVADQPARRQLAFELDDARASDVQLARELVCRPRLVVELTEQRRLLRREAEPGAHERGPAELGASRSSHEGAHDPFELPFGARFARCGEALADARRPGGLS